MKLTSVYKEFPRSGVVLKNVHFHLRKGEFVFLTGHSGAGKSTILKLLQMDELPTSGEVRISGHSSARLRRGEIPKLRRKLGVVFQDFRLLPDRTADRNVAFALEVTGASRGSIAPRVSRLLARVGLASKAGSLPHELSGGERQRVRVARALAQEPRALALDEPTVALDVAHEMAIFELLRDLGHEGVTILLV
ncbi:MAG: ATP-binding cassette domain-containing protein, partial [Gemmatimonadetes bacterium]|nr:ATP-binding cassette domain-containing protein [Gemmatimonadota bacterium]